MFCIEKTGSLYGSSRDRLSLAHSIATLSGPARTLTSAAATDPVDDVQVLGEEPFDRHADADKEITRTVRIEIVFSLEVFLKSNYLLALVYSR
jgi:hypothetical protein